MPVVLNSKLMLQNELETAVSLAREAGASVMSFYHSDLRVVQKLAEDNFAEPVTEADYASNKIIVEGLTTVFPNDGLLSEETPDDQVRLTKQRVWVIDPLDGTKGFINHDGDFAIQIGLAENGEPVLGVVYLPFEDILYHAVKNGGAWMKAGNGDARRLHTSDKTDLAEMNLAVSRDHRSPRMNRVFDELGLKNETQRGSVGLKVGLIAQQICDLYIHLSPRTKFWDTCAPQIILEEAGGKLTDLFGARIRYDMREVRNLNGVAATNGPAHDKTIATLKTLMTEFGREMVK
jgi:3'(2'), 5'-bisphosphate nucleotidase